MKTTEFYSVIPAFPITMLHLALLPLALAQDGANLHTSLIQISWMAVYALLLVISVPRLATFLTSARISLYSRRAVVRAVMYLLFITSSYFVKIINSTSLCVGRDTGDGIETLSSCSDGILSGVLLYSALVIPAIFYCSRIIIPKLAISADGKETA